MNFFISVDAENADANMLHQHLQVSELYFFFRTDLFKGFGNTVEEFIQSIKTFSLARITDNAW